MQLLYLIPLLVAGANAHGVLLQVNGANRVIAPGACILDNTPRNCIINACGAQADTSIIRDEEMRTHKFGPIGWTQGNGDCKPDPVFRVFMGLSNAIPKYTGGRNPTGTADPFESQEKQRTLQRREQQCLADKAPQRISSVNSFLSLPLVGFFGLGGNATAYPEENIIGKYAGCGQSFGLPTTDDDGELEVIYRQINQDGPGPLSATVDFTSGATDYTAFKDCVITHNVPGDGFVGLSLATNTNWVVKIQLPKGMLCSGVVAGVPNVCFVRIRNNAIAGPFGGAGFFAQSIVARERALGFRRMKRMECQGTGRTALCPDE